MYIDTLNHQLYPCASASLRLVLFIERSETAVISRHKLKTCASISLNNFLHIVFSISFFQKGRRAHCMFTQ